MSKTRQSPPLEIASRVTREHGERFAARWLRDQCGMSDAFAKAHVIAWPDGPDGELTPAQVRFQNIEDEILERTFAWAVPAIAEAFVTAAREVLARERRQR